jgi:hypothetical protein
VTGKETGQALQQSWGLGQCLPGAGSAVGAALAAVIASACARPLPPEPPTAALYRDLERLVTLTAAAGWEIDRLEIERLAAPALMSVCQVSPEQRADLLAWLDGRIAGLGGPVDVVYARSGGSMKEVRELLELTRIRMTLVGAIASAPDDCPFWVEPKPRFRGRQILDDRWLLSFGGGGKGMLVSRGGKVDAQAGGAGRLLFGRAIGARWAALGGVEVGGNASFPRDEAGERSRLTVGVDLVTPLALRYTMVNTYIEGEVGPLFRATESDKTFEPGYHVGLAFGGSASRRRWFFPGAAFGVSYERTFPRGDPAPLQMFKVGFRVAIDIGL